MSTETQVEEIQTGDNNLSVINEQVSFDSSYDDLANKVAKNKNSPDNSERAYRIAGIIDLKTGTTKDMIYQVDLGEAEKVAKENRDNTFYGTNGIDVPDYSALATPVSFQSKKTMLATIADTASLTGTKIKEGTTYIGNKTGEAAQVLGTGMKEGATYIGNKTGEAAQVLGTGMKEGATYLGNNTISAAKNATKYISETIDNTFKDKFEPINFVKQVENKYNTNNQYNLNDRNNLIKFIRDLPEDRNIKANYVFNKFDKEDDIPDEFKELYEKKNLEDRAQQLQGITGGRRHKSRRSNKTKNRKFYSNKTKRSNKRSNKTRKSKA